MSLNGVVSLEDLIDIRDSVAGTLVTEQVTWQTTGKWNLQNGAIQHNPAAFFEIVGIESEGETGVLIEQRESALVALITKVVAGQRQYLLAVRAEPGLQKRCVLTSTIQSTPSNLDRTHGGKPTDYYEFITTFNPDVRIIYESFEFDYGFIYLGKSKRFVVLEVDIDLEAKPNFVWVGEPVLREALSQDFLIGTDLRALLAVFLSKGTVASTSFDHVSPFLQREYRYVPLESLNNLVKTENGFQSVDENIDFSINFFKTHSPTRENSDWIQPLLSFHTSGLAVLPKRYDSRQIRYGVTVKQEFGMMNRSLVYPAIHLFPGSISEVDLILDTPVMASLEGGRFLNSNYVLGILESSLNSNLKCEWISEEELFWLLHKPMTTSVELRLAASLLLS